MAAGCAQGVELEVGHVVGARHGVVHEGAGQQLAGLFVIDAVLQQRLADALHQPAMHLAFDNHRVDDVAEVVHRREAVHLDSARGRVDLDLADISAGREGEVGRVVKRGLVQARLELVERVVVRHVSGERHLAKSDFLVGALDGELAVGKFDVSVAGFHQVGRDFLGLGLDLVERLHDGRAAHRHGTRTVGAHAKRHAAGVAVNNVHRIHRDAQARRHHLRKRGLVALAVAVRTGEHRHAAGRVHAHFAAFKQARTRTERAGDVAGRQAAGLDVARVADATQQALRSRCCAALLEAGHFGQLVAALEQRMKVAHVVLQGHRRLVRKVLDEVAAADLVLPQPHLPAATRHQALEQISGLRPAGAAVSVHRCGVGEPGVHLHIHLRRAVLAGQQRGVQDGRHGRRKGGQISTHVGVGVHTQRQELAVLVHRHFSVAGVIAAMRVADKGFAAVSCPLDRAVELFGRPGQAHVFSVQVNLGAEAATHVGSNDAHLVLGQAHHKGGQQQPLDVRVLVGHIQRVVVGGAAVVADDGARLHGVGDQAVVRQVQLGDVCSAGKSGIDLRLVAQRPVVAMVVGRGIVQGSGLGGLGDVDNGAQHLIVHIDQLGGVLGLFQCFGHHHGNVVANVAHLVQRQDRVRRLLHGLAVGAGDQPAARQAANLGVSHVLANQHIHHAGRGLGSFDVDALDAGMRMRRTHEHRVGLAGDVDVVGVLATAGEKAIVFFATDRCANVGQVNEVGCTHVCTPEKTKKLKMKVLRPCFKDAAPEG